MPSFDILPQKDRANGNESSPDLSEELEGR